MTIEWEAMATLDCDAVPRLSLETPGLGRACENPEVRIRKGTEGSLPGTRLAF